MSVNGIQTQQWPLTVDGLSSLNASSTSVGSVQLTSATPNRIVVTDAADNLISAPINYTDLVPYTGATAAVALGAQNITTSHVPAGAADLTNKTYVDGQDALRVLKAGDTMTGTLTVPSITATGLVGGTPAYTVAINASNQLITIPNASGVFTGSVSAGYLPYASSTNVLANSIVYEYTNGVGIGTTVSGFATTPTGTTDSLTVNGSILYTGGSLSSGSALLGQDASNNENFLSIQGGSGVIQELFYGHAAGSGFCDATLKVSNSVVPSANNTGTMEIDAGAVVIGAPTSITGALTTSSTVTLNGVTTGTPTKTLGINASNQLVSYTNPGSIFTGSVSTGYLPYASSTNVFANSLVYQSGSNVGIGITNPSYPLTLSQSSGDVYARIQAVSGATGYSGILFTEPSTYGQSIRYNAATDDLEFCSQDGTPTFTQRMVIKWNGSIGIGTTNPGAVLDVRGAVFAGSVYVLVNGSPSTNGYTSLLPGDPAHTGYINFWQPGGTRTGYIGYVDNSFIYFGAEAVRTYAFSALNAPIVNPYPLCITLWSTSTFVFASSTFLSSTAISGAFTSWPASNYIYIPMGYNWWVYQNLQNWSPVGTAGNPANRWYVPYSGIYTCSYSQSFSNTIEMFISTSMGNGTNAGAGNDLNVVANCVATQFGSANEANIHWTGYVTAGNWICFGFYTAYAGSQISTPRTSLSISLVQRTA